MAIALARPLVDHALAFTNALIVFGRCNSRLEPQSLLISDGRANSIRRRITKFVTFARGDGTGASGRARADEQLGFAAVAELADFIGLQLFDSELNIALEKAGTVIVAGTISVDHAQAEGAGSSQFGAYLDLACRLGLADKRLASLFASGEGLPAARAAVTYAIDVAGRSHTGFVAEGWIANARTSGLSFLTADGIGFLSGPDVVFKSRPDVSDHLRRQKQAVSTEDHGVLLNFPQCLPSTDGVHVLREDGPSLVPLAHVKIAFSDNRDRLLEIVSHAVGGGKLPRPAQARKFFLPFFTSHKPEEEFSVNWIRRDAAEPRTSIIVPLFREYRFIFSLLTMQRRFPGHYEWIFVSDDPSQHQILTRVLEKRSDGVNASTALVANRFNYGFAISNNIGISVARGRTLLFMNSDIWVDSVKSIEEAARIVEDKSYAALGFRLLYEDGTVQHDGMAFRPSRLMHDLLLADHPGKGTPPDAATGTVAGVPAVTGALMMMSKELFLRVGQFDRAYIKGDFEDADLCLKVRNAGGRIGLYKTNDIFHLERQSIRLMGGASARLALTYLNCITFNERWGQVLARPAASEDTALADADAAPQMRSRAG